MTSSHRAANLSTICDFTRWAMTEMTKNDVSLGHGTADYWEEASVLVMRTLGLPFEKLEAFWNAKLTPSEIEEVTENIERRVKDKVPLAYLIHEGWLSQQCFYVDERVLIPRSFIAELLEEDLAPWVEDPENIGSVLDMCTGSGCLAILAAQTFPNAQVVGADISADALDVAAVNRERFGLEDDLELVQSDLFENLQGRKFDLIISNPPYVTEEAMQSLPGEYRAEPALALRAGEDGMDVMRRMMPALKEHLSEQGLAVIEIGDGREAFEAIWPQLPVTWLTTSGGDDLVFVVRAQDLKEV